MEIPFLLMKGDFMKKIIAFIIAVFLFVSLFAFSFSVSADGEPIITNQEYYAAQSYLIAKYKDGDISYSEFQQQSQAVTDEFVTNNTIGGELQAGALNASNTVAAVAQKIGNTVEKYGDAAREYISDYTSDFFNSYTVLSDKPITDLKGGVSMLKHKSFDGSYKIYYGNASGEVWYNGSSKMLWIPYYCVDYYDKDGNMYYSDNNSSSVGMQYYSNSTFLYGSWKLRADDTDVPTDDEFETVTDYDFSEVPERELEDLLKKILDEMEIKEPDLSTMEGLLRAIYARLGTLDSDNDNELLSSVNSAILALVKSNNDNNEALLNELLKFREELKNGTAGTDTNSHGHAISGTLYNVIPLDKNWLNRIFHDKENLKVQYEGKTYYLEDCGCLKLYDKFYSVDINYSSQIDVDYDFSFDEADLNFGIKNNKKFYDVDFGSLNDLYSEIQSKNNAQTYSMRKSSVLGNDFVYSFSDILTNSQERKLDIISDLIEQFISVGVPFRQIKENFSTFETILFKLDYIPRDLTINYPYDHSYISVTILSYKWFNGGSFVNSPDNSHGGGGGSFGNGNSDGDGENDNNDIGFSDNSNANFEYFTKYSKVVRAFTSILISFSWVLSMYKKMSNLI